MKAIINGSDAILDYFRLTYKSMPVIRTIVHNIKDIKKWPLQIISSIEIASIDNGMALCTVEFQDGTQQTIEFEESRDDSVIPRPRTEITVNRRMKPKGKQRKLWGTNHS